MKGNAGIHAFRALYNSSVKGTFLKHNFSMWSITPGENAVQYSNSITQVLKICISVASKNIRNPASLRPSRNCVEK